MGADHRPRSVKQLRQLLLAQHGLDAAFQDEQDSKCRYVQLSAGRDDDGVFHYELTLDAEGRAVLEAAIGPLSKPQPEPDGDPDPRPAGRRRGEAVIQVCRRCTAAGGQSPSAAKAAPYVTMTLEELKKAIGAATTIGSVDGGALLAPETVRKLACDASIIPIVLGSDSEILDEGRAQRLFTGPQLKALWLRDKHCTFRAAKHPRTGPMRIILNIGWTAGPPIWTTPPYSAAGTLPTCGKSVARVGPVDGQVLWDRRPGSYK